MKTHNMICKWKLSLVNTKPHPQDFKAADFLHCVHVSVWSHCVTESWNSKDKKEDTKDQLIINRFLSTCTITSRKDEIALSLSSISSLNLTSWLRASASFFLSALCCSLCISSCLDSSPLLLCIISINWVIVSSLACIACCWASSLELNSSNDLCSINVSLSCRSFSPLKSSNSRWIPSCECTECDEDERDRRPVERRSVCSCCCCNRSCRSRIVSAFFWKKKKRK